MKIRVVQLDHIIKIARIIIPACVIKHLSSPSTQRIVFEQTCIRIKGGGGVGVHPDFCELDFVIALHQTFKEVTDFGRHVHIWLNYAESLKHAQNKKYYPNLQKLAEL